MPVRPPEHDFRADNPPSRVQGAEKNEATQTVRNPCPNHPYRRRTKRMGQVAEYCALCMDQQEMAGRWKNIRKTLATLRHLSRKPSAAAKSASAPAAKTQWEVSIVRIGGPATATEGLRVLVVIN
jgi:hypothetical protein